MACTFKPIDFDESLNEETHAAHCLLWFKDSSGRAFGLMQLRSDGLLGFGGGFVSTAHVLIKFHTPSYTIDASNWHTYSLSTGRTYRLSTIAFSRYYPGCLMIN